MFNHAPHRAGIQSFFLLLSSKFFHSKAFFQLTKIKHFGPVEVFQGTCEKYGLRYKQIVLFSVYLAKHVGSSTF